jgi:hypothetical protein
MVLKKMARFAMIVKEIPDRLRGLYKKGGKKNHFAENYTIYDTKQHD